MADNIEINTSVELWLPVFNPISAMLTLNCMAPTGIIFGGVLAFNKSTGAYCPTNSSNPDTANAKAIALECRLDIVMPGAEKFLCLIGGEGPDELINFENPADTLDTIPAGSEDSYRVQLRKYGIYLRPVVQIDEFDNQ